MYKNSESLSDNLNANYWVEHKLFVERSQELLVKIRGDFERYSGGQQTSKLSNLVELLLSYKWKTLYDNFTNCWDTTIKEGTFF